MSFNYGTPHGIYASAKDYLNSLSRAIPNYVVGQNIARLSPFMRKLLANAEVKDIGFPFASIPVVSSAIDNVQKIGSSMEFNIPMTISNSNVDMATFYANLALATITVSDFEVKAYESGNPEMLFNAIEVRASQVYVGLMEKLREWLTGTRVSGTEDTTQFYGLRDVVDNGTLNANYGNINRATNTWWNSYSWNAQTTFGSGLPAYQYVIYGLNKYANNASIFGMPDVAFTSYGVWSAIASSLTSMERIIVGDIAKIDDTRQYEVTGLAINGVPIFPDPSITGAMNQTIFFVNFNHLKFMFANGYAMAVSEWKNLDVAGSLSQFCYMLFGGQLVCSAPASCFMLTNMPVATGV